MEVLFNRPLLDQLLLEIGVPEERIKSLRLIVHRTRLDHCDVTRFLRLLEDIIIGSIAFASYNLGDNILTVYAYMFRNQTVAIKAIAHESYHAKQGWGHTIFRYLWAVVGGVITFPVIRWLSPPLWSTALLPIAVAIWMLLSCFFVFPRTPWEREAEEFAEQALSDPRWHKVIKIESPES